MWFRDCLADKEPNLIEEAASDVENGFKLLYRVHVAVLTEPSALGHAPALETGAAAKSLLLKNVD